MVLMNSTQGTQGLRKQKLLLRFLKDFSLALERMSSSDKVPCVESSWWLSALSVMMQQSSGHDS